MFKDWLIVMRKQWSWKNDRITWYTSLVVAAMYALVYHFFAEIIVTPEDMYSGVILFLYFVILGGLMVTYHGLKFLILGTALAFVVYCKEKSPNVKDKAQSFYDEAMEWRQ